MQEDGRFPIMLDPVIAWVPWAVMAPHAEQARKNHGQSLQRLAERGGLSCGEALAVIEDREWEHMDRVVARQALRMHVVTHAARPRLPQDTAELSGHDG